MGKSLLEKPLDYTAMWRRYTGVNKPVRAPVPRMTTTSTGAPIRESAVLIGPTDFCPEG